jgi:ABC-type amino acid transport system permease subunit
MMFKTTSLIYVVGITDFFQPHHPYQQSRVRAGRALHHSGGWLFRMLLDAVWIVRRLDPKYVLAH